MKEMDPLTESALLNLFGSKSKHAKSLDHYLDAYLRHRRSQGEIGVDSKAFEEISEAFEQIDERIVARADATGCL